MKLLVLALSVALLFAAGEALTCHKCVSAQPGGPCTLSEETCSAQEAGCVSIKFTQTPFGTKQKCMAPAACEMLKLNAYINVKCCTEDMCNTL